MEYKYPPIFKYIILLLCIFMFIKHLKIMVNYQNAIITIMITIMIIMFDYIFIDNHPEILGNSIEKFSESDNIDIDDILKNYNIDDIDDIDDIDNIDDIDDIYDIKNELDDDRDLQNLEYPTNKQKAFYKLPTDYKKPSYELNTDCYRRGNGNNENDNHNQNVNMTRYYTKNIL